jgi:hypothetical protein
LQGPVLEREFRHRALRQPLAGTARRSGNVQ